MSAHDTAEHMCECDACVAEDLATLATHSDPLAAIAWPYPGKPPQDAAEKDAYIRGGIESLILHRAEARLVAQLQAEREARAAS